MTILGRRYTCKLLLVASREEHLWSRRTWLAHFDQVDAAVKLTRGPYAEIEHDKIRKLGLLRWNRQSIEKWALPKEDKMNDTFSNASIWCPDAATVDKENDGPDAFFALAGLPNSLFPEALLICAARDFHKHDEFWRHCDYFLDSLVRESHVYAFLTSERPWGKRPKDNITNQMPFYLSDIGFTLKRMTDFDHEQLPGKWTLLSSKAAARS